MPSKKFTFKKAYEIIDAYEESTWMGNDIPVLETEYTGVFNDRYPCVEGHKLFIPKKNTPEYIGQSYSLAYEYGTNKVAGGEIAGFNVGMNIGICAGQTILWPHIHFIPRHDDDAPEIGGMRHAHPGADHKRYY
jgi:diadenosine tetraphosphate (Ap4A) HIT family hydrolase|tara:strand:- start:4864 stop:5265 length:402 start_codon:yes stop_codon:yes gene_type:complete